MKQRGMVTFVFDDGYQAVFEEVVPLLDQYHLPAVFAVPLQSEVVARSEGEPTLPVQKWLTLTGAGHEIAAHSVSHRNLTTLSPTELATELAEPARELQATTLVYPGGAHNETVVQAAKQFYKAARTVERGFERKRPTNPWR
ncbi:MAG: polysaccharide deacetylase family protein, partial [Candidatus Andersenbacteria bacterium]